MKKYLLLILPAFTYAQENATTTLTVNVSEIYSIIVDSHAAIDLDTKDKFLNGAVSNETNLNVFATNGYRLTAVNNTQNLSDIELVLKDVSEIYRNPLNQIPFEIFESNVGTLSKDLKVVYELNDTENYLNLNTNELQTTITFTITPF